MTTEFEKYKAKLKAFMDEKAILYSVLDDGIFEVDFGTIHNSDLKGFCDIVNRAVEKGFPFDKHNSCNPDKK